MKPIFPLSRAAARLAIAAVVFALVSGCGNKGPLVPPKALVAHVSVSELDIDTMGRRA